MMCVGLAAKSICWCVFRHSSRKMDWQAPLAYSILYSGSEKHACPQSVHGNKLSFVMAFLQVGLALKSRLVVCHVALWETQPLICRTRFLILSFGRLPADAY